MEEMIDMFGNINDVMNMYQQMQNNPVGFLSRRFNIPQGMNDPNGILQHLLSSGQVSQAQVNNVMGLRNNPIVQKLMQVR